MTQMAQSIRIALPVQSEIIPKKRTGKAPSIKCREQDHDKIGLNLTPGPFHNNFFPPVPPELALYG